ncbi:MAG: T9SS type A sorting domain-containing protein [Bacteroidia bacterium]|nr:T9SS type A sorting domain-containing protein [Bacteroidia bacterium]
MPTSWLWDFGDGATSTLQNPSHGYVFQGVFNVCLKAYNSCGVDQSCQSVVVTAVGVEDDLENSLHIYPNPTSGRFILETELPDPQQVSWKLTNVLGQQILGRNEGMLSGTVKRDIDLSEFSDGVYFFYITVGDRTHTRKVVKD